MNDLTPFVPALTTIANEEGTDKGTVGPTDCWPANNYTDVYEAYLAPLRNQPITLLEIGLGVVGATWQANIAHGRNARGGASIRMWHRYFPRAEILGIDVNPASFLDNDRITTGVVDQSDSRQIRTFLAESGVRHLDIVIDDGSHRPDHQQISFATLFPYVRPGGLYFIEDLMNNGRGDGATGRHASADVVNTRRVFRAIAEGAETPRPNALWDDDALREAIASVTFHCPAVGIEGPVGVRRAIASGWPFRRAHVHTRFLAGEEKLCAVRKKAQPAEPRPSVGHSSRFALAGT
jgi:hypothetical protein